MAVFCEAAERICGLVSMFRAEPERCRQELQDAIAVDQGTLRRYLRAMEDKGLIVSRKQGRSLIYVWIAK